MSLCVSFYDSGQFLICADSRVSSEVNGEKYLVTDDYRKIRQVGNKVVFLSGEVEIVEKLYNSINEHSTIHFIQRKAQKVYRDFKEKNKENEAYKATKHGIEFGVYIFTYEFGNPVFYQLNYSNNFELDRQVPKDKTLFTVAAYSTEALPFVADLTNRGVQLEEAIMKAYEHFSDEIVGGNLHSFLMNKNGITSKIEKIKDNKRYKKWTGSPFIHRCDMFGNVVANALTANSATISNSAYNNGTITGSSINIGNGAFTVNTSGAVSCSNINITGGSINWSNISPDPKIATAQSTATNANNTANSAVGIANAIVAGTYTGGTFIDGKTIYSPYIRAGTLASDTIVDVRTDVNVGNNIEFKGTGSKAIKFDGNSSITLNSSGNMILGALNGISFTSGVIFNSTPSLTNGDILATKSYVDNKQNVAVFG